MVCHAAADRLNKDPSESLGVLVILTVRELLTRIWRPIGMQLRMAILNRQPAARRQSMYRLVEGVALASKVAK